VGLRDGLDDFGEGNNFLPLSGLDPSQIVQLIAGHYPVCYPGFINYLAISFFILHFYVIKCDSDFCRDTRNNNDS